MAKAPAYAILGRGRWAVRMHAILAGEHRRVVEVGETRRAPAESAEAYRARLAERMSASGAQIAWICVLPGPHVPVMVDAALDAGLHIVVEKPWQASHELTETLGARARLLGRLVAVHYEYCFLSEVQRWRQRFCTEGGLRFHGRFFLNRSNHMGMTALDNVGSHLLAIRAFAMPHAAIGEIRCGYERTDERCVWLEQATRQVGFIDLLNHTEPIIQRFVTEFEGSLAHGEFPLGLAFGARVADGVRELR
jgi:predicted dehydrogenase